MSIKKNIIIKLKNIYKSLLGEVSTRKLISRGLKVGTNFSRQFGCYIDPTHCWLIEIGDNVTFSINVTLLAHDASTKKLIGFTKIGKIKIGNNVFIGANSIILPNVKIGNNCIIGAGSLITSDIPENVIVAGNPAKVICSVEEYRAKHSNMLDTKNVFDSSYTIDRKSVV